MRRILATLALLLIGWTTVEPASLAGLVSSSVPMCCRKGGKHHCAGTADATDDSVRVHAVSPGCPHRTQAITTSSHFQFEALSELARPHLQVYASIFALDSSSLQVFVSSGVFDRGPPQLFLLIAS